MQQLKPDEYRFDKNLEDKTEAVEFSFAKEYCETAPEDQNLPDVRKIASEYEGNTAGGKESEKKSALKRHGLLKKLMLIPIAAIVSGTSVFFASFNYDPLGNDLLVSSNGISFVSPENALISTPEDSAGEPSEEISESDSQTDGEEDAFPVLPNLEPDFEGKYAWSDMGSEEYVVVDSHFLHAGTFYTDGGTEIESLPGASYDKSTNTLTLNNYHGSYADVNLMGNSFKIRLVGENSLDSIMIWGAMYGGSVTFTGSGSIKINESGNASEGLYLECEFSPSCLMIDREATVEVFGDNAIIIHCTTLEKAIYTLSPIVMTGGEFSNGEFVVYDVNVTDENGIPVRDENGNYVTKEWTVKDISEEQGETLYDYSVIDADGKPSKHVLFKPDKK